MSLSPEEVVNSAMNADSSSPNYDQETIKADTERLELENREWYNIYYVKYAELIPRVVVGYLAFIGVLIFIAGLKGTHIYTWGIQFKFGLSDKVLITLLVTTTANILGLMYIVTNHLFPKNK